VFIRGYSFTCNLCNLWPKYELFYAKQSQFPKQRNEHKLLFYNELRLSAEALAKAETKPKQTQFILSLSKGTKPKKEFTIVDLRFRMSI